MSDYDKIKKTSEYQEARREVQAMINRDVQPLARHVDEIGNAVRAAEEKLRMLEEHPKAFTLVLAAIFGAFADNPAIISKVIDNLQISLNASVQQNAHPAILAELNKAMMLLTALQARH
jgi:hypothetical protein